MPFSIKPITDDDVRHFFVFAGISRHEQKQFYLPNLGFVSEQIDPIEQALSQYTASHIPSIWEANAAENVARIQLTQSKVNSSADMGVYLVSVIFFLSIQHAYWLRTSPSSSAKSSSLQVSALFEVHCPTAKRMMSRI